MNSAKLICNPAAGRGQAGRLLPDVWRMLNTLKIDADVVLTRSAGEATTLAAAAQQAVFPLIIAMGGDGTLHEVANGIVDAEAANGQPKTIGKMGVIPVGTGNDFFKMLAIPRIGAPPARVWPRVNLGMSMLGGLTGAFFLNNVGIGFDAQVGIEAKKVRWLRGTAVYVAGLARNMLLSYRTPEVTVQIDDSQFKQSLTLLTIGNGRCSGGGFWLTPNAEIDDGLFDICLVRGLSKLQMLALVPKAMQGTHISEEAVHMTRARKITLISADPLPVHADGEILYTDAHELKVELLPAALEVIG